MKTSRRGTRRSAFVLGAFILAALCLISASSFAGLSSAAQSTAPIPPATAETIEVDTSAPAHPFPHFWEQMFGSGRAILSLRESYRSDLRDVKRVTDFKYVRFHAILDDEVGLYNEDDSGNPAYNFSYIDQIYDGLLANGVRPFVELSFMPSKLASAQTFQSFFYRPIVAPPKSWDRWADLISHLAQHLVDRYGIDEVSQWYFEVWNEPNIDFWAGEPKQETYFQLYDAAAKAIKAVNPRLRVGGPATAQAAWVDRFIQHAVENHVPLDFASTHVYGNDLSKDVFGVDGDIPRDQMVCRAVRKVHDQITQSPLPSLPLIWSEFNASYKNEPDVTDALYMGPWLANTVLQCDGIVNMMSYWTFSDVFEEQGVVKKPFYGGYGLIAEDGLPKPAFDAFELLHKLDNERLDNSSASAIVTRAANRSIVIALWNLLPAEQPDGPSKEFTIELGGGTHFSHASIYRLDATHGSILPAYKQMGEPAYPTPKQIDQLREAAKVPPPSEMSFKNGKLTIEVPAEGLAIAELH